MYLYNNYYKIFLSWSNFKLLSSELSTIFRWKTIDVKIYPLDFKEFLYFKNLEIENVYTEKQIWFLNNTIKEFLDFWAYPEVVLSKNTETKFDLIKSYFTVLLYKDLLERYWIENEYVIKYLIKKLLLWTTKEFNINKVFLEFKSQNVKVWKQTIYNYLEYLKEIFFIKEIPDEFKKWNKKFFFFDVWYNNIMLLENLWQRFENIVFLELNKRFENIVFRKATNYEIDFVIPEKNIHIHVCYDLNYQNFEREIKWFENIDSENKILVYFSKEKDFNIKWVKIINLLEFIKIIDNKDLLS